MKIKSNHNFIDCWKNYGYIINIGMRMIKFVEHLRRFYMIPPQKKKILR